MNLVHVGNVVVITDCREYMETACSSTEVLQDLEWRLDISTKLSGSQHSALDEQHNRNSTLIKPSGFNWTCATDALCSGIASTT